MLTRRDFASYSQWLAYVQESDRIGSGMRPVDDWNALATFADADRERDIAYYWHPYDFGRDEWEGTLSHTDILRYADASRVFATTPATYAALAATY